MDGDRGQVGERVSLVLIPCVFVDAGVRGRAVNGLGYESNQT